MRTYTFKVVLYEGCDEFWEGLKGTGCDEVYEYVKYLLEDEGALHCDGDYQNCELTLTGYQDDRAEQFQV